MRALALALAALAVIASPAAARGLELGLSDQPGGARGMRAVAPFGYRYQYLAGDIRSPRGWHNWNENGRFVTRYVRESHRRRITPVLTYYTLRQSRPGRDLDEGDAVDRNLGDPRFVKAWLRDIELALKRTKNRRAILHFEPDLFGHVQHRHGDTAPRRVRRILHRVFAIRDRVAPRVKLAYAVSVWGTNVDPVLNDPSLRHVDRLARRSARFYRSLRAPFDLVFGEMDDRDAGFNEEVNGDGGASWWSNADWHRHLRFYKRFHARVRLPLMMWQIPLGNSTLGNSWKHYRDDKVETLLGDPKRTWLKRYARAGVTAFLFGPGTEGCTTDRSDGGVFNRLARAYYRRGRVRLP